MANRVWRFAKCSGIGVLHSDPVAAAQFICDTVGGQSVDEELINKICSDPSTRKHILSGGITYEFVKPNASLPGTEAQFAKHGPNARSMCYVVEDVDAATDILLAEGCKLVHREPGYAWIDASEQCSLNFELRQASEWPCHTGIRLGTDTGPYMHSEIVSPDPHASAEFMIRVCGAVQVEKRISDLIAGDPEADLSDMLGSNTIHVLHGGMVYQFIAPCEGLVGWGDHMAKHGPSLHNTCYHVEDYDGVMATLKAKGCRIQPRLPEDPDAGFPYNALYEGEGEALIYTGWIDATEQCGMFIEVLRKCYQWPCLVGYFFW